MDNCDVHLGCFGTISLFSIYLMFWCFLGWVGYYIATVFFKLGGVMNEPSKKHHAILGGVIGISSFVVQLNIEYYLILLLVPVSLSFLYSLVLYTSVAEKG